MKWITFGPNAKSIRSGWRKSECCSVIGAHARTKLIVKEVPFCVPWGVPMIADVLKDTIFFKFFILKKWT